MDADRDLSCLTPAAQRVLVVHRARIFRRDHVSGRDQPVLDCRVHALDEGKCHKALQIKRIRGLNIWQFMRQNWLSNRIFKSFDDIVDHCCYAWNTLIDQPWKIMSVAHRDWAVAGHSL